jgi:hypothetical protein
VLKRLTSFLARASLTIRSSIVPRLFVSSSPAGREAGPNQKEETVRP